MNKVFLKGNIVNDLEVMKKENLEYLRFTIAVNDFSKEKAHFINCICFNKLALFVQEHFKKGYPILIEGSINTSSYLKDNERVYSFSVNIQNVHFCNSKKDQEPLKENNEVKKESIIPDYLEKVDPDDLPF